MSGTDSVPLLYRIYKTSVQRVSLEISSLNSHAAFLLVLEPERHILAWIGSDCESADQDMVKELGFEVLQNDMRVGGEAEVGLIYEGSEPIPLLELFMELIGSDELAYYNKKNAARRKERLVNNPVTAGLIEEMTFGGEGEFEFQETAFIQPDNRGIVPRITFAPIEMETIAYVNVGDQWDIWIARGCPMERVRAVKLFLKSHISELMNERYPGYKGDVMKRNVKIIKQGMEHTLFRQPLKIFTDFEPPGQTAPRLEIIVDTAAAESKGDKEPEEEEYTPTRKKKELLAIDDADEADNRKGVVNFWKPKGENGLDLSDVAYTVEDSDSSKKRKAGYTELMGEDINCITEGMLKVIDEENENPERRKATIEEAANNPASLIGYQVRTLRT